ncbi:MAG: hypothetical protein BWY35_01019 [Firmicutes bacterium ADurb.Bin248]|nr:MAG: hypothetical protein BWY35_01019 [Firmicutes bacterium ADurb.Bin248]
MRIPGLPSAAEIKTFRLIFFLQMRIIYETEYKKGVDEEEYILSDAQRGSGRCELP